MNENAGKWNQILHSLVKTSTEIMESFAGVRAKQELTYLGENGD